MFDNTYFMENDCFDSAEYTDYVQKNRQMDYSNDYRVRQFYIGGGADPDVLGIQVVIEPTYTDIVENLFHAGDGLSEPVLYKGLHGAIPCLRTKQISVNMRDCSFMRDSFLYVI